MDSILSGEKKTIGKTPKKGQRSWTVHSVFLYRAKVWPYVLRESQVLTDPWKGSSVQDICLLLSLEILCKDDPT